MSVKIRVHPYLHPHTGDREIIEVAGHNVGECLNDLEAQCPGIREHLGRSRGNSFELFNYIEVYVNGDSAYPDELTRPVSDGDEITLAVMMVGG